ncbi:ABC transporter ATP-binding protein [Palleronia sp. LCG004]|uniref:ABC transporter ATP-binding protein n=1 Tax=Palleronia sp. LCG004 TaxID=3079304 RepID=UPI002943671B|nr:ABC transporter ATP-binding protein [Palleronia sp. LCG004]WOI58236.1 ABC transporter ATP-binding protein [Palleronia sp. LCG004]
MMRQDAMQASPAARTDEPVVVVKDLCKDFGLHRGWFATSARQSVRAVDKVSFEVARGSCYAIVGESGSGKSTLARVLVGLLGATGGEVRIDGADLAEMSDRERRAMRQRVQLVLQDPRASLDPRMRVAAVLNEALVVHGLHRGAAARRRRIEEVIVQVGLGPAHLDRYPNELSGGQRQRVAIARAIICEPEILVLDEPVSALDVSVQAQIINLLLDLQADLGLTYVMITHDLSLVGHMADMVGVMYLGQFVEQGPAARVCTAPRHPYTASLLAAVPEDRDATDAGLMPALEGAIPSPVAMPRGCAFQTRCPRADDIVRRNLTATGWSGRIARSVDGRDLPRRCVEERPLPGPGRNATLCHFPLDRAEGPGGPRAEPHTEHSQERRR